MPKTAVRAVLGAIALALAAAGYRQTAQLHAASALPANAQTASLQTSSNLATSSSASTYRTVLDRYCVTCHNTRLRTANLLLDSINVDEVGDGAEIWEKVVRKLRSRAMPPPGRPRPDQTTYDGFASWLETALDHAAAAKPNPGRPAIHRLNRSEYTNAIRELLALEIDGRSLLPADDLSYGFDNNADLLAVSPGLLDRYMSAARKISRLAVGDMTIRPTVESYKVSPLLVQDGRMSEDLPFGSRGGIAIRHYFPLDAEYVLRIRLLRDNIYTIRGLAEPQQIEGRLDGERITVFTVGGQPQGRPTSRDEQSNYRPAVAADAGLEVRFPAKAGMHLVGVALLRRILAAEGVAPARLPVANFLLSGSARSIGFAEKMGVGSVEIGGPYNPQGPGDTPSRGRIFSCRPDRPDQQESCATEILSTLARRAYRRPVTKQDVETLLSFYRAGGAEGDFDAGIQSALARMLVDPEFLFRVERDPARVPPAAAYRLSDLELASRLSFFLWSSIPDDELLNVAAQSRLSDPSVLEQQVRRMLADPRSNALVSNFAVQWLHLRNMRAVAPDVNAFPEFDDNLREAFQRETELFLASQLREDRSVVELLKANYTYVNERLARHYGIPSIYGSHFRRVTFGDDARGGLLGHGSILTVTSYATRTSPVVRGKWVLDNLLGAPPPPPPPDAPALQDTGAGDTPRSMRERMEQHRANPVCASCHSRMDPLGFALENFDGIGKWRDTSEANTPIDASATLPDGTAFDGPAELRTLLLSRPEEFVTTVTAKLLTYALGRGIEYYDQPTVRLIVRDAASNDYRWSSIILAIAKSTPFQMRRSEP